VVLVELMMYSCLVIRMAGHSFHAYNEDQGTMMTIR